MKKGFYALSSRASKLLSEACSSESVCSTARPLTSLLASSSTKNKVGWTNPTTVPTRSFSSAASPAIARGDRPPVEKKSLQSDVSTDAKVVFDNCWKRFENRTPTHRLVVPREILWLNGAPGAGKGANTPFILKHRGLNRSVAVSSILDDNAEVRRRKDAGELIPDTVVGDVLLDCIFGPENDGIGLVVDGFPRTALQADFLKLLHDKLVDLHRAYKMTPEAPRFPRTLFKVVVLYVDEEESVRRQLHRAKEVQMHNLRVKDAGFGSLLEARTTDLDEKKARLRYSIFKHHYTTLLRLMQHFPFTLIDAMGSLKECELQIAKELRYQSSLDLDEDTYALIAHIPLAKEVVRRSRQQLVARLDWYAARNLEVFRSVLVCIDDEIIPMVKRCSLAGHAEFITANAIFHEAPVAVDMVVDVLSDRGFSVSYRPDFKVIPHKVDLKTGEIESRTEYQHRFRIEFDSERLRDHATRAEPDSESGALELIDKLGGPSPASFHYVPPSMDAEGRQRGSKGAKARALAQEAKAVGLDKEWELAFGYAEFDEN